ncbi:MAG TPA: histidine ammonia-lyase [Acidobacteriota bacterium]|nr:histidine ammonia-lyase [Acidobacteriota bacterium]
MIRIRIPTLYADLESSLQALRRDSSQVVESRRIVENALRDGKSYYGINTGLGGLADKRIPDDQILRLQRSLILSHSAGVGDPIPRHICRLMLRLKVHALGLGHSGISWETFERLLLFAENEWIPVVPSRGSVGASGDLAPLAHLSLPLMGLGQFWDRDGRKALPAAELLAQHRIRPLELQAKDGLSLVNGTQMMSAYGAWVLEAALRLVKTADILGAMSLEALQGSIQPFDERIQQCRPHPGQGTIAANIRRLLRSSEILESHRHCGKVQDPYCLRCMPQVHGATRDALEYAARVLETEMNSATDNPLVFGDGDIISGGNFHGQPIALALDLSAIALAELASISERRTFLLLGGHDGLPRLLMKETGINSGFMVSQYTAAALVSENKILCHPASVDSIPTSLGQEDHQSMGSIGALKLLQVFNNVVQVLAIELLNAAQALDYRQPLRPGRGVEIAHEHVRSLVPHAEADFLFQRDLAQCACLVQEAELAERVEAEVGELA